MLDIYDNAKVILSSCRDIGAVVTMIEEVEDRSDDTAKEACLAAVRCALGSVAVEIREAAEAIAKKASQ